MRFIIRFLQLQLHTYTYTYTYRYLYKYKLFELKLSFGNLITTMRMAALKTTINLTVYLLLLC